MNRKGCAVTDEMDDKQHGCGEREEGGKLNRREQKKKKTKKRTGWNEEWEKRLTRQCDEQMPGHVNKSLFYNVYITSNLFTFTSKRPTGEAVNKIHPANRGRQMSPGGQVSHEAGMTEIRLTVPTHV